MPWSALAKMGREEKNGKRGGRDERRVAWIEYQVEYVATPWGIVGVNVFVGLSKMGVNRVIYKWISRSWYEVKASKFTY